MIQIEHLDRLISVTDLKRFFSVEESNLYFPKLINGLPTTSFSEESVGYREGRFCLYTNSRMVHVRLLDAYILAEERLADASGNKSINEEMWQRIKEFVKWDMLETYCMLKNWERLESERST